MKRYRLILLTLLLILAGGIQNVYAADWEFDQAHSIIYFDVKHIYSATIGNFTDFGGTFKFDPNDLTGSRIAITVQAQSVNTQNTKRDNHLRSEEFFDVRKFPTISFNSSAISHVSGQNYLVKGDLTVKDVTKSIEVPFTFHGTTPHPFKKGTQVAGFDAKFSIDRLNYHVGNGKYAKMGVVGKDVDIYISLEMNSDK